MTAIRTLLGPFGLGLGALALALSACAAGPQPEQKVVTKEVYLPVARSCVPPATPESPNFPAMVSAAVKLPTAEERLQALGSLIPLFMARWRTVEPVLALCRQP